MAEKMEKQVKVVKEWAPNANQKAFMEIVASYEKGASLKDIEIDKGVEFKSGAINILVTKGLVKSVDSVRVSDIVYRGVKIGEKKDNVKVYFIA